MKKPNDIKELRDDLLEMFAMVKEDPRRALQAKEMANLAGKILGTIKAETVNALARGEEPDIPFLGKTSGRPLKQGARKFLEG